MRTRSAAFLPVMLAALALSGCGAEEPTDAARLLDRLETIDPLLNSEETVADANSLCADLPSGDFGPDDDSVLQRTRELFSDQATDQELSDEQVVDVAEYVVEEYCG